MNSEFSKLIGWLEEINAIASAVAVLEWDQNTYMPEKGAEHRGFQVSTLSKIAHEKFIRDEIGETLQRLLKSGDLGDEDSDEYRLVQVGLEDFERRRRLPPELVGEIANHTVVSHNVWAKARADSRFQDFLPNLQKMIELKHKEAEAVAHPGQSHYDALLEHYEPGMNSETIDRLFSELKGAVVPLVRAIGESKRKPDESFMQTVFPIDAQKALGIEMIQKIGFDMERGRQDISVHPFCTTLSPDDVRITTRFDQKNFANALFSSLHEAGHAMYEQNIKVKYPRSHLASGVSLGIHESQSRLWENIVGRSRSFWKHFFPKVQEKFPQFKNVDLDQFYFAINKVEPSLIRVDADEVTYNLHIMLRYEIERDFFNGKVKAKDLPEVWNTKMKEFLGIVPPDDRQGVLQDVHWSAGLIGYFPAYALGNLYGAQAYDSARKEISDLEKGFERGEFAPLKQWLAEKIHRHGRKFKPADLIKRATGRELSSEPFISYLRKKFGELYGLS